MLDKTVRILESPQRQPHLSQCKNKNTDMACWSKATPQFMSSQILHVSKLNSGFQKLLSSMVRAEASSLPRGLAHTVSRASTHDRNMQSIPAFLMSKYEKCKSPGLSQGLAGNPKNAFIHISCREYNPLLRRQRTASLALFSFDLSPCFLYI